MNLTEFPTTAMGISSTGFEPPVASLPATQAYVHLVDDDPKYLEALACQLQSTGLVVERYFSAEHFLATYRPQAVECVLLDLRMPGMTGLELLEVLEQRHCCPPLVMVSAFAETPHIVSAIQHGAIDYLVKPVEEVELFAKVRTAHERDRDNKRLTGDLTERLAKITAREREVMDMLLDAKNTLQIAHALEISPKTVEKHRTHIFEKLNVDNVPALIRLVCRVSPRAV